MLGGGHIPCTQEGHKDWQKEIAAALQRSHGHFRANGTYFYDSKIKTIALGKSPGNMQKQGLSSHISEKPLCTKVNLQMKITCHPLTKKANQACTECGDQTGR